MEGSVETCVNVNQESIHDKDSRKTRKMKEEAKSHHIWYTTSGPDIILKTEDTKGNRPLTTDPFDVKSETVGYSLNKNKRWENIQNKEDILINQESDGKVSFVSASVPRTDGFFLMTKPDNPLENVHSSGGGVDQYLEVEKDDIVNRRAKSSRASLQSLESNPGPGPRTRQERRKQKLEKRIKEENGDSDNSEKAHTRYTTICLKTPAPKDLERNWRSGQSHNNDRYCRHRNKLCVEDEYQDGAYRNAQDEYESMLDEMYEAQLDSTEPLKIPVRRTKKAVQAKKSVNEEPEKDEFPLRSKSKNTDMRAVNEKRESYISLREPLSEAIVKEVMIQRIKEWLEKNKSIDYLELSPPIAIIHKEQSEQVVGMKMDKCTFVMQRVDDVILFAAPKFCCNKVQDVNGEWIGWTAHTRADYDFLLTTKERPSSSDLLECPLCKSTESTIDGDTVVVQRISLFGLSCEHFACNQCWLNHCKKSIRAGASPVLCINPHCSEILSISQSCGFLSDSSISVMKDIAFEKLRNLPDSVECSACNKLLTPDEHTVFGAVCPCGMRTCGKCGLREHLLLRCDDHYRWLQLMKHNDISTPRHLIRSYANRRLTEDEYRPQLACPLCGDPNSREFKNWCDLCGYGLDIKCGDLSLTIAQFVECLKYRGKMMNGPFRKKIGDLRHTDKYHAELLYKWIEQVVYICEVITVRKFVGREGGSRKITKECRGRLNRSEEALIYHLRVALSPGGEVKTKIAFLEQSFNILREEYEVYL